MAYLLHLHTFSSIYFHHLHIFVYTGAFKGEIALQLTSFYAFIFECCNSTQYKLDKALDTEFLLAVTLNAL